MVKKDFVVKPSNLVLPCARKESKAGDGYLRSYGVMSAYSLGRE